VTLENKLIAIGAAIVLALGGVAAWSSHERQVGALKAVIAADKAQIAVLAAKEARAETLYVADTVRLTKLLTRYDTARVHDTLTRNDTVYVARAVADSTIRACTITLADCRAGWALANARGDSVTHLLGLVSQKPPSFLSHVHLTLGVSAIAAVDDRRLHWGPGISIGWTP